MKKFFSLLVLGICFLPTMSFTADSEVDLTEISEVLVEVESNNNPEAIGDGGLALGVLQIHEGVVLDVNHYYGTEYTHEDAKNPDIAQDLFIKYLSLGIDLYTKRCGYPPTEAQIVRMWNGGIYKGHEYTDTMAYLEKYKLQKKLRV